MRSNRFAIALAALAVALPSVAVAQSSPGPSPSPASVASPTTLSLADAEKIALARSPALAVARAAVDLSHAAEDQATSQWLPDLSGQASSTRSKGAFRTTATGTPAPSAGAFTSNNFSANLKQLIFDGGHVASQIAAAHYSTNAARLQLQRQVQSVLFTVAQGYYQALQARHQLVTAQDSLRLAQVQEKLVEGQFRAGVAARADVLIAQLPVAQAQLAVSQSANGEQQQLASLLNVMGLPSNSPVTLQDETNVSGRLPAFTDVLAIANNARPDLQAARETTRSAEASVRAARQQRFPNISASGSEGVTSTTPSGGGLGNAYSVGVAVSVPIFDGGLIRAQTESALANLATAQANEATAQLNVSLTVQQAYLGLQTAQAGVTSATAELAQARTVLAVTNAQYRAGVTTLPLLLNAQVGLTKAESDSTVALYNYKIAQQQLLFAEGMLGST